jgi:hypothetical protein
MLASLFGKRPGGEGEIKWNSRVYFQCRRRSGEVKIGSEAEDGRGYGERVY